MRFRDQVVAFDFAGIPMVGNMNTGYAIGLTAEGADVCERLLREEVAETEVAAVDAALLEHLVRGGFFSDEKPADAVVSAYLHVTQRCNLNCVGCYSYDDQRNCLPDAPLDAIERALDELTAAGCTTTFQKKDHLWTLLEWEQGRFTIPEGAACGKIYDGCHCGIAHMTALPTGDVYACRRMESRIGNVREKIMFDLFTGQNIEAHREFSKFEKCNCCKLRGWCRGCPAVAAGYTGNRYAPDPQCWMEVD